MSSEKTTEMDPRKTTQIDPKLDPYSYVGIIRNPDGSISRIPDLLPTTPPSSDHGNPTPVLSKDIPINQEKNTWARVYLPKHACDSKKLPLLVYIHGGGFVIGSASTAMFHKFCVDIASETSTIVVSVEYRLAPEHRLPAAYDDCMEALHWIKTSKDEWLTSYADLSNCFLMGSSAGGNVVYNLMLRAVDDDLGPLKIQGFILHQPFFGGVGRTPSEVRLDDDKVFPPCVADIMWELGLPLGADRDHEYSNPTVVVKSNILEEIKNRGWRILVTGCDGDPLVDRQLNLVKTLEEKGINVIGKFSPGGFHGYEILDESKAKIFHHIVREFVLSK